MQFVLMCQHAAAERCSAPTLLSICSNRQLQARGKVSQPQTELENKMQITTSVDSPELTVQTYLLLSFACVLSFASVADAPKSQTLARGLYGQQSIATSTIDWVS